MPGSNQDSTIGSETDKTSHLHSEQTKGKRDNWAMFQESFHVPIAIHCVYFTGIRRDCCTKEGSSRVPEGLAKDYGGTEAAPFAKAKSLFV